MIGYGTGTTVLKSKDEKDRVEMSRIKSVTFLFRLEDRKLLSEGRIWTYCQ